MGAKATADPITRIIKLTEAPTLVNGEMVVNLDIKVDIYSDLKEDWLANVSNERKLRFPVRPVGGDPSTGSQSLGSTYFQRSDWKIEPYSADHRLFADGNFYSEDGTSPFKTVTGFSVQVERLVSNIIDSVETGVSGLLPAESSQLAKLDEVHTRFDLDTAKQQKYADDGSTIVNDDYTLTKTDNGDGTFDIVRTPTTP